jgi:hypothetical protein
MSGIAAKTLRYFQTLRHLRLRQVADRVARKLRRVRLDRSSSPLLRVQRANFVTPVDHAVRLVGPDEVVLINRPGRVADAGAWNDPREPKLWLYNLHYFDWLVGERQADHRAWERGLITRWIVENPAGLGNGWEPYALSLRIVNWAKWLFEGNAPLPGMLDSLALQLRMLERTLEWHLLGNHLLANAKALFIGGTLFGGAEGGRWQAEGEKLLLQEWQAQMLSDGGHEERTAMYQAVLLEDVLDCLNAAQTYGLEQSKVISNGRLLFSSMLYWLRAMTHPDGSIVLFNDAVSGIAAPLDELLGYAQRLGLAAPVPPTKGILEFPETGYIRAQVDGALLLMDCAPVGPGHQPGHAHADTLGFEFSLAGIRILVSAGTSTYEIGSQRAWERSTAAHNCVVVDERNSSDVWAGFRVGRRARVVECETLAGPPHVISGAHDGYRFLSRSMIVSRRWALGEDFLRIDDRVNGGLFPAQAWLHLAPSVEATMIGPSARLSWPGGKAVLVAHAPFQATTTTRALGFNQTADALSLHYPLIAGAGWCELRW